MIRPMTTSVRLLVDKTVGGQAKAAGSYVNVASDAELRSLIVNREAVYDTQRAPQVGPFGAGAQSKPRPVAVDLPAIAAGATVEVSVTVPGVKAADGVIAKAPVDLISGLTFCSFVSADNTVKLRVTNTTGASIDPPVKTWKFWLLK